MTELSLFAQGLALGAWEDPRLASCLQEYKYNILSFDQQNQNLYLNYDLFSNYVIFCLKKHEIWF